MTSAWVRKRNRGTVVIALFAAAAMGLLAGCTSAGGQGGGGGGGGTEPPTGEPLTGAILLNTDLVISRPIDVPYTTPLSAENVRAFRLPVSGTGDGAVETGPEVEIATGLSAGERKTFRFEVDGVPLGHYLVGLRYTVSSGEERIVSEHTITLSGLPVPEFQLPDGNTTIYGVGAVEIQVSLGNPENAIQWRLFYVRSDADVGNVPADQLGTEIASGERTLIDVIWNISNIQPADYRLGISVTDSGLSIPDTVDAGQANNILTTYCDFPVTVRGASDAPETALPTIDVTDPAAATKVGFWNNVVVVKFAGRIVDESAPEGQKIDVFYDMDDKFDNGVTKIFAPGLGVDKTTANLDINRADLNLAEGTYRVGAAIYDGVNRPGVDYALGAVTVIRTPTVTVNAPRTALNYRPGATVRIAWGTNLPVGVATVDAFLRRVNKDGSLAAPEIAVVTGKPLSVVAAEYTVNDLGIFKLFVRLRKLDGTVLATSEGPVLIKVTTRPSILWVGDLASPPEAPSNGGTQEPIPPDAPPGGAFAGAVFEGHNFEDNCGSAFMNVEDRAEKGVHKGADFNGDKVDDFMILSRYGKPEFQNPSGIGVGEAYLIRGSRVRFAGSYNVNTVSTELLPGMVFTGVQTFADDTLGLLSVTRVSDADRYLDSNRDGVFDTGDGVDELIFSQPSVFNEGMGRESFIVRPGHFKHGGVVIVSSRTPDVAGSRDKSGGRVPLEAVGQHFDSDLDTDPNFPPDIPPIGPEPDEPSSNLCDAPPCWIKDLWHPAPESPKCVGETLDSPVTDYRIGCARNSAPDDPDGAWDSLAEPTNGFYSTLARTYIEAVGLPACSSTPFPCPACVEGPYTVSDKLTGADPPVTTAHYEDCGNADLGLACSQFDYAGVPIFPNAFDPDPRPDPQDSCMYIYLPETTSDCPTEAYQRSVATHTAFVPNPTSILSGFFRDRVAGAMTAADAANVVWNHPREPFGARIIGRDMDTTHPKEGVFGFSVTQSGGYLIFSAPQRDAADATSFGYPDVAVLPNGTNADAGVGFITDLRDLWTFTPVDGQLPPRDADGIPRIPPKPHMYLAGPTWAGYQGFNPTAPPVPSECDFEGGNRMVWTFPRRDITFDKGITPGGVPEQVGGGLSITGQTGDHIRQVLGIPDFNNDTRPDIAIGAPQASGGAGTVYVLYRRARSLEGDYVLDKIALDPNSADRLAGAFIKGPPGTTDGFGEVIVGGVDFGANGDAAQKDNPRPDLVIASPYANGKKGEVWIVFAGTQAAPLITPAGGATIYDPARPDDLFDIRKVARITGSQAGDLFGFNVANAGDIDADGFNDLLVSAPGATPRFDSDPFDANDVLDTPGIDREPPFGVADNVDGPLGIPDKDSSGKDVINDYDKLTQAGVVYVILSGIDTTQWATKSATDPTLDPTKPMEISIDKLGSKELPGFILVGRRGAVAGDAKRPYGDQFAGGRAGDPAVGGILAKDTSAVDGWDMGRSFGLAGAGDTDADGFGDIVVGSILADPRIDPDTGVGTHNGGETYLIYGFAVPR